MVVEPVDAGDVLVVDDGSTDRTAEIASGFNEIHTIVFPVNRGYGAAIKEGWRQGKGEFVLMVQGSDKKIETESTVITDEALLKELISEEIPVKKAAAITARLTGRKKNALYQKALSLKQND